MDSDESIDVVARALHVYTLDYLAPMLVFSTIRPSKAAGTISARGRLLGTGSERQTHARERRGDVEYGRSRPDQAGHGGDARALVNVSRQVPNPTTCASTE